MKKECQTFYGSAIVARGLDATRYDALQKLGVCFLQSVVFDRVNPQAKFAVTSFCDT